jgi:hypothetical protein
MALASPEEYDNLALVELEAASAAIDLIEKKRRLNQASQFATLAELGREFGDRSTPDRHSRTLPEGDAAQPQNCSGTIAEAGRAGLAVHRNVPECGEQRLS